MGARVGGNIGTSAFLTACSLCWDEQNHIVSRVGGI